VAVVDAPLLAPHEPLAGELQRVAVEGQLVQRNHKLFGDPLVRTFATRSSPSAQSLTTS
jgi:hypothetical protein